MRRHIEFSIRGSARPIRLAFAIPWCWAFAQSATAQLASVQCCVGQDDLIAVGQCMSGPGNTEEPATCEPAGACVLGFGSDMSEMTLMCDFTDPTLPQQDPGFCESWSDPTTTVLAQCVANTNDSLSLFHAADADGDGDLDLADATDFINLLQPAPNLNQSPARIVSVECCFPESATRNIGVCLSGPEDTILPPACMMEGVCTVGFSAPVGPGDFLYTVCEPGPVVPPDVTPSYCTSWADATTPSVQECNASFLPGLNPFFVFDADGDTDVDIEDFAEFQNTFELPTGAD